MSNETVDGEGQPVSQVMAKKIAQQACMPSLEGMFVTETMSKNWHMYFGPPKDEPCWYVVIPSDHPFKQGKNLSSYYVVVVSQKTGKVLFKGSAMNEG